MKKLIGVVSILAFFSIFTGCSQVKNVCERLDECNVLIGSVDNCVDDLENQYDMMSDNQQDDWNTLVKDCLDFSGCEMFCGCYGC